MQVVSRPRQGGKTTEAVEWVKADPENRVLICPNEEMARYTRSQFGLTEKQVIGYYNSHKLVGQRKEIGLDNADGFHWRQLLSLGASLGFYINFATETRGF